MALEAIVGVLERLEDPEVEAVRIVQYGMKAPWRMMAEKDRHFQGYELAGTNEFDIGVMIEDPDLIPVFQGRPSTRDRTYPMFGWLGSGFGSVNFHWQGHRVKCYPRLVHALKAYASNISMTDPRSVRSLRSRREPLCGLKQWLQQNRKMLGGLRIEARINAPSVTAAVNMADDDELCQLERVQQILGPESFRTVTIRQYLENLER